MIEKTTFAGKVYQHLEYFPFGEVFLEESTNTGIPPPYLFSSKEIDAETGLSYFGARYYDPRTSRWLGVDPMFQKYPGWSPYIYCGNNPINYFDPNGKYRLPKHIQQNYPLFTKYMKGNVRGDILKLPQGELKLHRCAGKVSLAQIDEALTYGKGPILDFKHYNENGTFEEWSNAEGRTAGNFEISSNTI